MMRFRRFLFLGFSAASAMSACSRPVLYYPETYPPEPKASPRATTSRVDSSSAAPMLAGAPAPAAGAEYLATRHIMLPVAGADPASLDVRDAGNQLANELSADVVQVIGRTATLYRENPDLKRKDGVPPWRTG
jgi:hypothetical protein